MFVRVRAGSFLLHLKVLPCLLALLHLRILLPVQAQLRLQVQFLDPCGVCSGLYFHYLIPFKSSRSPGHSFSSLPSLLPVSLVLDYILYLLQLFLPCTFTYSVNTCVHKNFSLVCFLGASVS